MEPISFRFAAAIFVLGCGAAIAQTPDSTAVRRDTVAALAVPVGASLPVAVDSIRRDTIPAEAKRDSVPAPKMDTTTPLVVKPDSVVAPAKTKMAALDSSSCHRKPVWSIEGTVRHGWRQGALLEEEDRLTRQFKVVLVDKNDDTSNVNPVASGVSYQLALWLKSCCGHQFGIGFEYANFSEHPVSTYSSGLTEDFIDQYLITARYRKSAKIAKQFNILYDLAAGYSRSTIQGIPLVYANRNEPRILLTSADRAIIESLHTSTDANGFHGELGVGGEFRPSPPVGFALKVGVNTDKIWRETSVSFGSGTSNRSNAAEIWSWGFDIGLSASHDF